jgi:predicted DNA-binding ribbon-helix-helix protein
MDQVGHIKKSAVIKHSILINSHKTSVSLENEFWRGLREIAEHKRITVPVLVEHIDRSRDTCNLSSAIRIFVYNYFRREHT